MVICAILAQNIFWINAKYMLLNSEAEWNIYIFEIQNIYLV